jgi:hypothetical protein
METETLAPFEQLSFECLAEHPEQRFTPNGIDLNQRNRNKRTRVAVYALCVLHGCPTIWWMVLCLSRYIVGLYRPIPI